jgi:hypothetical protein
MMVLSLLEASPAGECRGEPEKSCFSLVFERPGTRSNNMLNIEALSFSAMRTPVFEGQRDLCLKGIRFDFD